MKLSFHQHIALFWMIGAPGVFAPVIENAKRPDAGAVMAWGVAIVAVMILFTPLLLRCPPFRRWYGRTDALSERQRQALAERGLRRGTVAKLAMRQPFVLFKGLTFQKLCLPGAFRPGDHHNKMLRPGLCVVHASPQYL